MESRIFVIYKCGLCNISFEKKAYGEPALIKMRWDDEPHDVKTFSIRHHRCEDGRIGVANIVGYREEEI